MTDGGPKNDGKTRGEQLAERLAGSNPVEPKPNLAEPARAEDDDRAVRVREDRADPAARAPLAGTPRVEPKPGDAGRMDPPAPGEPRPAATPPTSPPVEGGAADAASTKAADAHAHANPAADQTTKPPAGATPEPPTMSPGPSGAADAASTKAAATRAHANPAADAATKPPAGSGKGDAAGARGDAKAAAAKGAAKPAKGDAAKGDAAKGDARPAQGAAGPPPAPPWYRTLRAEPPFYVRMALGFGMVALVFGLWWFLTRGSATEAIVSPSKLVSPSATFGATNALLERDLLDSIIDTMQRVFLGIGLAALVGVVIGVLAGAHRGISASIAPLVIFLRSVPMGALLPLTLIMFGDGDKQKWMFIFLAVVPFVFSDTVKAIASVPDRYVETAQTLGASKLQIILKVLVPLSLPDIITSLRFQFGLALGYIMLAEAGSTFVEHGLGTLIAISERRGLREHVFLLLFVIALLAFTIDLLIRTLQRGVFPWRKDL